MSYLRWRVTCLSVLLALTACRPVSVAAPTATASPNPVTATGVATTRATWPSGPLAAGAVAPSFGLDSSIGVPVDLAIVLQNSGPVVLVFYPGGDCRLCRELLQALEDKRTAFEGYGFQLLGIGRQSSEGALATAVDSTVAFPLLADEDGTVSRAYGVPPLLPGKPKAPSTPFVAVILDTEGMVFWSGPALTDNGPAPDAILKQLMLFSRQ